MLILVFPDELAISELLKVLVVGPKRKVLALALIARHLIQNAEISSTFIRTELVRDLAQQ